MPIYEYRCEECGVQFEELWKTVSKAKDVAPCPECGTEAPKIMSPANHQFAHTPSGPVPQNTGVSQIDHSYDRVIGRDAEAKWAKIEERNKVKDGIIRDEANAGRLISRNHLVRTREGAGEYRVVTEPERQEINARRKVADVVQKASTQPASEAGD
jgi:putative FmdB family regulatory protein